MSPIEKTLLKEIKRQIEEKYFSDVTSLRGRDLDYLATLIQEKSGISLSLSTLKRFWKADFTQSPHVSTLDALVSLLGYKTWQDFKLENSKKEIKKNDSSKQLYWVIPVLLLTSFFFYKIGSTKTELPSNGPIKVTEPISFFTNKTITEGVPNTVIFNYDVKGVAADSFFIQQSWNKKHKVKIDPQKNIFTSIYYTPSFHKAKLIANDSILATQNVHITSKNWSAYAKYSMDDRIPMYLENQNFGSNGQLIVQEEDLLKAGIDLSKDYYLRYCNIRNFDTVDDQNFTIETKMKMIQSSGTVCPLMELMLVFERDIFWLNLTQKGCENTISYKIGEHFIGGRDNDLSSFGCDLKEWQNLELKVKNRQGAIFLNGKTLTSLSYEQEFGQLKGVIYTFKGIGIVDYFKLAIPDGPTIYEQDFDQSTFSANEENSL